MRLLSLLCASLLVVACSDDSTVPPDGGDAGGTDATIGNDSSAPDTGAADTSNDTTASDSPSDSPTDSPADVATDANQCTDGVVDGNETDVDCGGGTCPKCASGKKCKVNGDCTSNKCQPNKTCQ